MDSLNHKAYLDGFSNRSYLIQEMYSKRVITTSEYKEYWRLAARLNEIKYSHLNVVISNEDLNFIRHINELYTK